LDARDHTQPDTPPSEPKSAFDFVEDDLDKKRFLRNVDLVGSGVAVTVDHGAPERAICVR